jgi:hypothetical protein
MSKGQTPYVFICVYTKREDADKVRQGLTQLIDDATMEGIWLDIDAEWEDAEGYELAGPDFPGV